MGDKEIIKAFILHANRLHLRDVQGELDRLIHERSLLDAAIEIQTRKVKHYKDEITKENSK
jgi:hypothetical protein